MSKLNEGDVVVYTYEDVENKEQEVKLVQLVEEGDEEYPQWGDEPIWIVEAVGDGPLYEEGEQDYARPEELTG
jgi:hypothetical protein